MSKTVANEHSVKDISKTAASSKSEDNFNTEKYIQQLSESERQTYEIAHQHLESSFSVEKSIGYLKWKDQ